jgi:hypothetical protein
MHRFDNRRRVSTLAMAAFVLGASLAVAVQLVCPASAAAQPPRPGLRPTPPVSRPPVVVPPQVRPTPPGGGGYGNGNLGGGYGNPNPGGGFQGGGFGRLPAHLKPDGWKTVYQYGVKVTRDERLAGSWRLFASDANVIVTLTLSKDGTYVITGPASVGIPSTSYPGTDWFQVDGGRIWLIAGALDNGTPTPLDLTMEIGVELSQGVPRLTTTNRGVDPRLRNLKWIRIN